ncbi:hypothetical protein Nepgr_020020 [Nepenthes gracilis]|uniref:Uncharacterized protein n=1 Tax=Nepenthes gracilis TaxID=150966 RepID=A0AAD3XVM3_NEPGR|nr:hypothetical protein Nepgr_020020 [Nepenthes gracilis]
MDWKRISCLDLLPPLVDPELEVPDGPMLPTKGSDEFKPFFRRLPEFELCGCRHNFVCCCCHCPWSTGGPGNCRFLTIPRRTIVTSSRMIRVYETTCSIHCNSVVEAVAAAVWQHSLLCQGAATFLAKFYSSPLLMREGTEQKEALFTLIYLPQVLYGQREQSQDDELGTSIQLVFLFYTTKILYRRDCKLLSAS